MCVVWALEKWHLYVEGSHCIVFSDHQALAWLWKNQTIKGRLIRWVLRLQDFQFEIRYRPGVEQVVPGALSRAPVIASIVSSSPPKVDYEQNECYAEGCKGDDVDLVDWVQCDSCEKWFHFKCVSLTTSQAEAMQEYYCKACSPQQGVQPLVEDTGEFLRIDDQCLTLPSKSEMCKAQREDSFASSVLCHLESTNASQNTVIEGYNSDVFCIKDDLLVYGCNTPQIVVPYIIRPHILHAYHNKPSAGHMGVTKTLARVSKLYWWPCMAKLLKNYVKACRICQMYKPLYRKPAGFMQSTSSSYEWEVIAMDLMGPLPCSPTGHQHLLVIVDHLSKFCLLFPLKRATGRVLAAVLRHVFCTFGAPARLLSDNAPNMLSTSISKLLSDWF